MQAHYLTVEQQIQLKLDLEEKPSVTVVERLALDQLRDLSSARERQQRFFAIEANRLEKNRKQAALMRDKARHLIHAKNEELGKTMCGRIIFANTTIGKDETATCKTCIKALRNL